MGLIAVYSGRGICNPSKPPLNLFTQDCTKVTKDRTAWETRGSDGALPLWHSGHIFGEGDGGVNTPQPPWVQGADIDSIPGTRQAQADIWAHQHPKVRIQPLFRDFRISGF
jgi:hypothetical protein